MHYETTRQYSLESPRSEGVGRFGRLRPLRPPPWPMWASFGGGTDSAVGQASAVGRIQMAASTNRAARSLIRQRAALSRRVANMTAATAAQVNERPAVSGEPRCSPRVAYFFLAAFFLAAFLGAAFFLAAFFLATFRPPSKGSWRDHFRVLPFHEVHAGPSPFPKPLPVLFGKMAHARIVHRSRSRGP
jgi:hypothetical protein